jgi:DNA-binding transcriptional LysR family regulator
MDDSEMKRLNRIEEFWNWLPAFRAVAETEHVGDASENVHKSPSALSRAVSLLEDDFEVELFERTGREIRLTAAGREFLTVARKAMRLIDEGMRRVSASDSSREFSIGSSQRLGWMLEGSASSLTDAIEETELRLSTTVRSNPREELLRGELDLLITHQPIGDERIDTDLLVELDNVLCGPDDHPRVGDGGDETTSLEGASYVAPPYGTNNRTGDGWPRELERDVACRICEPRAAARMASEAGLLTILPRRFFERDETATAPLQALETDHLLRTPVFAARRTQLVDEDLAAEMIGQLNSATPFTTSQN